MKREENKTRKEEKNLMEFNDLLGNATYYSLSDIGEAGGAQVVSRDNAKIMNENNYGIFWTLNEFKDNIRRKENLIKINCWAIDIDESSKLYQMDKIKKSPLLPSMIIETKRGYQCYWFAKDASIENYSAVVENRLIPFFGADTRAKDVCRILRVPGFMHCKDPNSKFLIKLVEASNDTFREDEMLSFFKPELRKKKQITKEMRKANSNGIWAQATSIPIVQALQMFSGHPALDCEVFDFSQNTNGTLQIVVNGKKTSSWIDHDGLIGSYDGGGPTLNNWLFWYLKDWKKVYQLLSEVLK